MSNIKGGGRATLSDRAEEALVSLLMSSQESKKNKPIRSDHERNRESKRFVKNLVARYERNQLSKMLNNDTSDLLASKTSQLKLASDNDGQKSKRKDSTKSKVRVELVEAVYGKKGKSAKAFKDGAKKVMVFPTSMAVPEFITQAQAKLRIKKPVKRVFVVEKKIEMDLMGDLSGIKDGTTIYVTSQEPLPKETKAESKDSSDTTEILANVDPLESVKEAYTRRKQNGTRRIGRRRTTLEHPDFMAHLNELPSLPESRARLPAASCRDLILENVQNNRVVVICGATGCGKSTQVPQFLLEGMKATGQENNAHILVTQPRRVAAISLAQRVADEMESPSPGDSGSDVGYNVRLDRRVSETAKIVYCTVGILLRMLVCPKEAESVDERERAEKADIPLSRLSHIVIDEVHERDMNTDFVLTLLRILLRQNQHLRIILMSATASASLFVEYFADHLGKAPTVIDIPGRSFPVETKWLADCEKFASSRIRNYSEDIEQMQDGESSLSNVVLSPRATNKIDNNFIKDLICAIANQQQNEGKLSSKLGVRKDGAVLVFLPGRGEIEGLFRVLVDNPILGNRDFCNILRLHSAIPRGEQQVVFSPAQEGTMKIVLATNIAETSITIPDVSHVIDTGRVKESRFNSSTRIKELVTVWTSRASAKQRAGRAGRTSAGVCWKLYSEKFSTDIMPAQTSPEIVRTPLDELVMQVCLLYEQRRDEQSKETLTKFPLGACPLRFLANTPEPPPVESLQKACQHLLEVDALRVVNENPLLYRLTPLGYHLSHLPMDSKVGKVLIIGCMLECLNSALTVAATLSCTKSCFFNRWGTTTNNSLESSIAARNALVETGFGGRDWKGGTVKGDLIAAIAVYREWSNRKNDKERASFCKSHALDNVALKEIHQLRSQFLDCLKDAGFVNRGLPYYNRCEDDAVLTSCCLVAGLYPNICTLMRPRKGGPRGGRLLTKEGDACRPQSTSFQRQRVDKAYESGKDAYAVYHGKHRSVGTGSKHAQVFLSEVNFISRFTLLLFGGELEVKKNAIVVDDWLKFKIGDKGVTGAVLLLALRDELDNSMLQHIVATHVDDGERDNEELLKVVRLLLADE